MQRQELDKSMVTTSIIIKIAFSILSLPCLGFGANICNFKRWAVWRWSLCRYVIGKLDAVSINVRPAVQTGNTQGF